MVGITVPKLETVPNDTPVEELLRIIYRDGAVHVRNLVSLSDIDAINQDILPYMKADYNAGLNVFAKETKAVAGLAGKSPNAVRAILQNKKVRAVVDDVLTDVYESWWGDSLNKSTSPPLLSSFFTVRVGPGSARQGLHRDDQDHHPIRRRIGDPKETTKFGVFVATTKTTQENGATEVVPGSHLWDDHQKPSVDQVTYGEMEPGDGILMLGHTYHGAGANKTADELRGVVVALFCRGVCRPEENQFLAVPREVVEKMDYDIQDLLGWKASAPFCGWLDFSDPSDILRGKDNTRVKQDLF